MKSLRLQLDDEEPETLAVGLIRLAKNLPAHEFFFHLNQANPESPISRRPDFLIQKKYYDYRHLHFEGYDREYRTCLQFFGNQSSDSTLKIEPSELFLDEDETHYLLPQHKEVDFILKTSDNSSDFSLLLWPENLMFSIQNYTLNADTELFSLLQYYE